MKTDLPSNDPFIRQYMGTALWSTTCYDTEDFENLDDGYDLDDVSDEAWARAKVDCDKFRLENASDIEGEDETDVAHDFWLTRNGHGAGFWDGDYEKEKGDRLTKSSHEFGECWIFANDDGKIDFL